MRAVFPVPGFEDGSLPNGCGKLGPDPPFPGWLRSKRTGWVVGFFTAYKWEKSNLIPGDSPCGRLTRWEFILCETCAKKAGIAW